MSVCLFVLLVFNCGSGKKTVVNTPTNSAKSYPLVDQQLWPFFEKFEAAAKQRGRTINLATQQIKATIEPIPASNVGLCSRTNNDRVIIIDQKFWTSRSLLSRELIVFHELGHCSLQLEHRNSQEGGICKSIMRSGHEGCLDNYTPTSRAGYLDELFGNLD